MSETAHMRFEPGSTQTWPEVVVQSSRALFDKVWDQVESAQQSSSRLAWRGMSRFDWPLRSTLDRALQERSMTDDYKASLKHEWDLLAEFQRQACKVASNAVELSYLPGCLGTGTWTAMALGRHCGLPTRLLDWSASPWVAAFFACVQEVETDGTLWWFDEISLETLLGQHWNEWNVPTRAQLLGIKQIDPLHIRIGLEQRALEHRAFTESSFPWICKLNYPVPFRRMEAQSGSMTVCGRVLLDHNVAIDQLPDSGTIARGRIRIPAAVKDDVLRKLRLFNIHAESLNHPALDMIAAGLCRKGSAR